MKSKAPLAMMEQMVMILVFALAAALCLQAFVKSDQMSQRGEARDRAVTLCQNVAEDLRHSGGDLRGTFQQIAGISAGPSTASEDELAISFDADLESHRAATAVYWLRARRVDSGTPGLCKAVVWVETISNDPETLFEIEVAWQEVVERSLEEPEVSPEDRERALAEAEQTANEITRCIEGELPFEGNLWGETDGLGGWRQYFDEAWNLQSNYVDAVFELWYSDGEVNAYWNAPSGESVQIAAVEVGQEVSAGG